MRKYFDVIPSEDNTACVLLYGDIGDSWDGCDERSVTLELMELAQSYSRIDVRINSYGGEVYAGLAIFNALKSSKADIHIYVDGVAASMAAVIALCGKPVEMSQYASIMLHSASTYVYGNRQEMGEAIRQLEALDATLAGIVSGRLGMSQADVMAKYFDGKDHWITAEEALASGLVDALYDVEDMKARASGSPHGVYMMFNQRLRDVSKPQNNNKLMDKVIVTALSGIPSFTSCSDDAAAIAKISQLVDQADKVSSLEQENKELKEKLEAFERSEQERQEAEIKETLDQAEQDGIISQDDRSDVEALLRVNPTAARKMLERIRAAKPSRPGVKDFISSPEPSHPKSFSLKTWEDRMREIDQK